MICFTRKKYIFKVSYLQLYIKQLSYYLLAINVYFLWNVYL